MGLLADNRKVEAKAKPGQDRSLNRPINPDWEGGRRQTQSANQDRFNQPGSNVIQLNQQQNKAGGYNRPTVDQNYAKDAFTDYLHGPLGLGQAANDAKYDGPYQTETANDEQYYQDDDNQEIPAQPQPRQPLRQREASPQRSAKGPIPSINLLGGEAKARLTASRITASNASWIGYLWLFVQMPLAIVSIMCFGFVGALDSIINTDKSSDSDSYLGWLIDKAIAVASSVVDTVAKFIGVDFAEIAMYVALACYALILFVGFLSIFGVYVQYIVSGIRPTTGKSGGLKTGMLLVAIIGYSTPFLNMFPCVGLWMWAVWYHPK